MFPSICAGPADSGQHFCCAPLSCSALGRLTETRVSVAALQNSAANTGTTTTNGNGGLVAVRATFHAFQHSHYSIPLYLETLAQCWSTTLQLAPHLAVAQG